MRVKAKGQFNVTDKKDVSMPQYHSTSLGLSFLTYKIEAMIRPTSRGCVGKEMLNEASQVKYRIPGFRANPFEMESTCVSLCTMFKEC